MPTRSVSYRLPPLKMRLMNAPDRVGAPKCAQYTIRRGPGEVSPSGVFAGIPAGKSGGVRTDQLPVDRCGPRSYNHCSPFGAGTVSVAQLAEHQTVALA